MKATSGLRFPKKSHRKHVLLPKYSVELAEFFGTMLGDGGINNPWQANITLNAVADKQYANFLVGRCKKLFNVFPAVRKRKSSQGLVISIASTTVVDFLVNKGLPRGNKIKSGLRIPAWILLRKTYRIACVRGLVDTDGCLYVHVHRIAGKAYKNIGLCFTSYSQELLMQVALIFEQSGILAHISADGRKLHLYRADAVERYLRIIGTSNERILRVYKNWRRRIAV